MSIRFFCSVNLLSMKGLMWYWPRIINQDLTCWSYCAAYLCSICPCQSKNPHLQFNTKVWKSAHVLPFHKRGQIVIWIIWISIVPHQDSLIGLENVQLHTLLSSNSILNRHQSGFRPGHSNISAALFVALSKAFYTGDHCILMCKLSLSGSMVISITLSLSLLLSICIDGCTVCVVCILYFSLVCACINCCLLFVNVHKGSLKRKFF